MINKQVFPDSFDYGIPSVELIGHYSKGLDKSAMDKRASAFTADDLQFERKPGYKYLHIITTGGMEKWAANCNGDAFNLDTMMVFSNDGKKSKQLDGGLLKYHNKSYMSKNAAVYKEHQTKRNGAEPSGYIAKAAVNVPMCRGELIIGVDENKWRRELQKKANGGNIYFSMGCDVKNDTCFPQGTLVDTPYGWKPIETLEVGDEVRVAEGAEYSRVSTTFKRVTTDMCEISVQGIPLPIQVTPNHPIKVCREKHIRGCSGSSMYKGVRLKRRHSFKENGVCSVCGKHVETPVDWVNAGDIAYGDYIAVKIDSNNDTRLAHRDFAYLCGHYCGDGYMIRCQTGHFKDGSVSEVGIGISASGEDRDSDILDNLIRILNKESNNSAKCRRDSRGKNAYVVSAHDAGLANRVFKVCGAGSRTKYVSRDILNWSAEEKLAFIGGLIDADGYVHKYKTSDRVSAMISSVNKSMLLGAQRLLWAVGIPASMCVGSYRNSTAYNVEAGTPTYSLHITKGLEKLEEYSIKLKRYSGLNLKHNGPAIVIKGGYAFLRVTDIKSYSCEPTDVYNIEVEGYHTYCAEGLDVHNCSVCLNEAATREDYCDHIKHHLGKLTKNGSKVFTYNDAPEFYDISGVACPADKIAFALREVKSSKTASFHGSIPSVFGTTSMASKVAAAMKIAELEKRIPVEVTDDLEDACCCEEAEKEAVEKLKDYRADEVLDALHRKGIMLGPEAFYNLISSDTDDPKEIMDIVKDIKIDPEQVFYEIDEPECQFCDSLNDSSYDLEQIPNIGIMGMLDKFMPMLSSNPEDVRGRTIQITITKRASQNERIQKFASDYISEDYARYATSFVARNPDKALFALTKIRKYSK